MKVLWIVLGVLGGLCLVCGVGFFFLFNKGKAMLDDTGKFGDESFQAIAANWDLAEFQSRAAPEIAEQNGKDAVPNMLARLKASLGPVKTFSSKISNFNAKNYNGDAQTTADWSADATFEKGKGTARMTLINRNGVWKILNFHVDSPLLTAAPPEGDSTPSNEGSTPANEEATTAGSR